MGRVRAPALPRPTLPHGDAFWQKGLSRSATIVILSVAAGLAATLLLPKLVAWMPYDYTIYIEGAGLIRDGQDPYAVLPYWYPLPVVLFTTLPLSFLPDNFAWAFAFIPLGLLHIRYGRNTLLWWLFFPLLINVAYAQMEGWLVLPLFWLLEDQNSMASLGALALMFKPAYIMFLLPYRIWQWLSRRHWRKLAVLFGLGAFMVACAFLIDPAWPIHMLSALARRADNPELAARNMTLWPLLQRGVAGCAVFVGLFALFMWLIFPLVRLQPAHGHILLAASLLFFPNGLNPVSSMMVMPMAHTRREIVTLVTISWVAAGLDVLTRGWGGSYQLIVFVALYLTRRRYGNSAVPVQEANS